MHISDRTLLAEEIEVKNLFYGQWYDGEIWGVCEYQGDKYIYSLTNVDNESRRIYAVLRLDKEVVDNIVRSKWSREDGDVSDLDPLDGVDLERVEIIGRFCF